jgi:hypothetical protein
MKHDEEGRLVETDDVLSDLVDVLSDLVDALDL